MNSKIHWLAFFLILLFGAGCAPVNPTTLTIYNASDRTIKMINLSGIKLYSKGSGPQELEDFVFGSNFCTSMATWQTVRLTFPIKVEWQYEGHRETQTNELTRLINRPGKDPYLKECGNILLVFETNEIWSVTYMSGDVAPSLQKMEKLYRKGVCR